MKNHAFLLLAVFCCTTLISQNTTTWFVPGAQWKYEFASISGNGEEALEYVGDEVVNGQLCAKLHVFGYKDEGFPTGPFDYGFEYFFSRNDSVFWWSNDKFVLLYDFTRMPGDTFPISQVTGLWERAIVDSVGTDYWQSIPLRFQDLRLIDPGFTDQDLFMTTRVWERIGGYHFFYWNIESPVTEINYYPPCYRDDEYPQQDCDLFDPDYIGFPDGTAIWSEESTIWCGFDGFQYKMEGDTLLFGSGLWKKVYYRNTYTGTIPCPEASVEIFHEPFQLVGLLRQSLLEKKVYFRRLTWGISPDPLCIDNFAGKFPIAESVVLYDFDLDVGDTVSWRAEPNVVLFIDSIQLNDGSWRRTYHFKSDSSYFWIEGIGSNLGLLNSHANVNTLDLGCALRCFRQDNDLKYNVVDAVFCDSVTVAATEPPLETQINIYPNPASGSVTLEMPENALPALFSLFDAQGKRLTTKEINAPQTLMDLSPWSSVVVLFIQIQSTDGRRAGRLLRVER